MTVDVMKQPTVETRTLKTYLVGVRRGSSGFDRWDGMVLGLWCCVLAFAIRHYLPFADEAQAWLIARDSSLHEMLFRRLHYEGAGALWPLILWVATRLQMPYSGINWMAGAFALPGIYLLLRYSPFPRLFRWLMPFTYFFQYQYAVIARPYVLVAALLFTMCILFRATRPRPVLFAAVAGVLANISLHTAIIAGILCLLYLYELRQANRRAAVPVPTRSLFFGAGVFALLAICALAPAFPAPDVVIATKPIENTAKRNTLMSRVIGEEQLPPSTPPLDEMLKPVPMSKADEQAETQGDAYPLIVRVAVITTLLGLSAAFFSISTSNVLAAVFLGVMWLWFWARGCPRLLLPFLLSLTVGVNVLVLPHHTGIFLLSLVAAVWIALPDPDGDSLARHRLPWIQPVFAVLAMVVIVLQIGWSWHCIHSEIHTASDPGRATEQFLVQNYAGKRIAGFGFESVSAQPYAANSLFFNQPHAYWVWSINVFTDRRRTEVLGQHPDVVVTDDFITGRDSAFDRWFAPIAINQHPHMPMITFWEQHGYRPTHRICGDRYSRLSVEDELCEVIMEPEPAAKPGIAAPAGGAAAPSSPKMR